MEDNRNYAELLRRTMNNVNVEGHTVILMPGRYNAAYFEHYSWQIWETNAFSLYTTERIISTGKVRSWDWRQSSAS